MIKLALLAAGLILPAADATDMPLPPPRPVELRPDMTGEGIRIVALARFAEERCAGMRINRQALDATLARLNVDLGYAGTGEGRAIGDSFQTVYGGNPRKACDVAWGQLGPDGSAAPGVLEGPR